MTAARPRVGPVEGVLRVVDLRDVSPAFDEVVRMLGNHPTKAPRPALTDRIRELMPMAQELARPRGVYGLFRRRELGALELPPSFPAEARFAGAAAVTAGQALEAEVARLSAAGDLPEATILDAAGSQIAEAAAERVDALLGEEGAVLRRCGLRRSSPGYGDFPLEQQPGLISLTEAGRIGIRLGKTMVMTPRKSVTFAKPFLDAGPRDAAPAPGGCDDCDAVGCNLRRPPGGSA